MHQDIMKKLGIPFNVEPFDFKEKAIERVRVGVRERPQVHVNALIVLVHCIMYMYYLAMHVTVLSLFVGCVCPTSMHLNAGQMHAHPSLCFLYHIGTSTLGCSTI